MHKPWQVSRSTWTGLSERRRGLVLSHRFKSPLRQRLAPRPFMCCCKAGSLFYWSQSRRERVSAPRCPLTLTSPTGAASWKRPQGGATRDWAHSKRDKDIHLCPVVCKCNYEETIMLISLLIMQIQIICICTIFTYPPQKLIAPSAPSELETEENLAFYRRFLWFVGVTL